MKSDTSIVPETPPETADQAQPDRADTLDPKRSTDTFQEREIGGRKGLEPTRYGDWEKNGRCIDF